MSKHCVGISWGNENGIVSLATLPSSVSETQHSDPNNNEKNDEKNEKALFESTLKTFSDSFRTPSILANADGNRASALWMNVANDEFLLGDGAKNATMRFPQQSFHNIIQLLEQSRFDIHQLQKYNSRCSCGNKCAVKNMMDGLLKELNNNKNKKNDVMVSAVNVNYDDDDENEEAKTKTKKHSEHLNEFLKRVLSNYSLDANGLVVPENKTQPPPAFPEEEYPEEPTPLLPKTTWDCALCVCRLFRTIIRDSIGTSTATSPNSEAAASAFPTTSAAGQLQQQPQSVVVAVPRHNTNTNIVQSLLCTAWSDWSGAKNAKNNNNNNNETKILTCHDDVAALAAVISPQELLVPSSSSSKKKSLTLVVNWGSTQLSVSLLASNGNGMLLPLSTKHISHEIGGNYLDQLLVKELLVSAQRKKLPPVSETNRGYRKFLSAAERAKIILSTAMTTSIEIESAIEGMDFVESSFTRSKLENIMGFSNGKFLMKFQQLVTELLQDASLHAVKAKCHTFFDSSSSEKQEIEFGVILAGGMLRIPTISSNTKTFAMTQLEKWCQENFPSSSEEKNNKVFKPASWNKNAQIDPQEIISIGACNLAQAVLLFSSSSAILDSSIFVVSAEQQKSETSSSPKKQDSSFEVTFPLNSNVSKTDHFLRGGRRAPSPVKFHLLSCDVGVFISEKSSALRSLVSSLWSSSSNVAVVLPKGAQLPVKRDVAIPISDGEEEASLTIVVQKQQTEKNVMNLKFPLKIPKNNNNNNNNTTETAKQQQVEFFVSAEDVLKISVGGEMLLNLQL